MFLYYRKKKLKTTNSFYMVEFSSSFWFNYNHHIHCFDQKKKLKLNFKILNLWEINDFGFIAKNLWPCNSFSGRRSFFELSLGSKSRQQANHAWVVWSAFKTRSCLLFIFTICKPEAQNNNNNQISNNYEKTNSRLQWIFTKKICFK